MYYSTENETKNLPDKQTLNSLSLHISNESMVHSSLGFSQINSDTFSSIGASPLMIHTLPANYANFYTHSNDREELPYVNRSRSIQRKYNNHLGLNHVPPTSRYNNFNRHHSHTISPPAVRRNEILIPTSTNQDIRVNGNNGFQKIPSRMTQSFTGQPMNKVYQTNNYLTHFVKNYPHPTTQIHQQHMPSEHHKKQGNVENLLLSYLQQLQLSQLNTVRQNESANITSSTFSNNSQTWLTIAPSESVSPPIQGSLFSQQTNSVIRDNSVSQESLIKSSISQGRDLKTYSINCSRPIFIDTHNNSSTPPLQKISPSLPVTSHMHAIGVDLIDVVVPRRTHSSSESHSTMPHEYYQSFPLNAQNLNQLNSVPSLNELEKPKSGFEILSVSKELINPITESVLLVTEPIKTLEKTTEDHEEESVPPQALLLKNRRRSRRMSEQRRKISITDPRSCSRFRVIRVKDKQTRWLPDKLDRPMVCLDLRLSTLPDNILQLHRMTKELRQELNDRTIPSNVSNYSIQKFELDFPSFQSYIYEDRLKNLDTMSQSHPPNTLEDIA